MPRSWVTRPAGWRSLPANATPAAPRRRPTPPLASLDSKLGRLVSLPRRVRRPVRSFLPGTPAELGARAGLAELLPAGCLAESHLRSAEASSEADPSHLATTSRKGRHGGPPGNDDHGDLDALGSPPPTPTGVAMDIDDYAPVQTDDAEGDLDRPPLRSPNATRPGWVVPGDQPSGSVSVST